MRGKYLTDSEFRRRVKKVHGNQFTVLSSYHNMRSKVKVRCNVCGWIGETRADYFLNPNCGAQCPLHDKRQYDSSSFQKAVNQVQDGQYTLLSEYTGYKNKVKIKCNICGREFYVWSYDLLKKRIGKNCNHRIYLDFEQASKRLNKIFDGEIKLIHFSGMREVATFKCHECGNIWQTEANNVLNQLTGCPYCASSKGEKAVTEYLKKKGYHFEPQFRIEACRDKLPLPFDFAVFNKGNFLNCLIEYQGCQHYICLCGYKKNDFFSKESIISTQKHDKMKLAFCKEHGIQLICIDHPQTASKFDKPSFITDLVKRVLDKELKVN